MEINFQTPQHCPTLRQSQHCKRTYSHLYAQNTWAWTNQTAVCPVDRSRC